MSDSSTHGSDDNKTVEELVSLLTGKRLFVVERSKTELCSGAPDEEDVRCSYIKLVLATTQQEAIKKVMGAAYDKAKLSIYNCTDGTDRCHAEYNNWEWHVLEQERAGYYDTMETAWGGGVRELPSDW